MKLQPDVKLQLAAEFAGIGHVLPHAWQFITVERLVSQPSESVPLQSSKRALQDWIRHVPVLQVGVAFARVHGTPHPPQLLTELSCTSQPLPSDPSQFS